MIQCPCVTYSYTLLVFIISICLYLYYCIVSSAMSCVHSSTLCRMCPQLYTTVTCTAYSVEPTILASFFHTVKEYDNNSDTVLIGTEFSGSVHTFLGFEDWRPSFIYPWVFDLYIVCPQLYTVSCVCKALHCVVYSVQCRAYDSGFIFSHC